MDANASPAVRLIATSFDSLAGWGDDRHAEALSAFRRGAEAIADHPPRERATAVDTAALAATLRRAAASGPEADDRAARAFFETGFLPHEIGPDGGDGFFTGYYEPVVEGALSPIGRFRVPLHRRPDDLVEIGPGEHPPHLDASLRFARKTAVGLREHPDRAAIAAGALSGRGLELVYVESPIDAFFIHVQGSARIRLTGGGEMRVTYAAKSGHPYTPIGRVLVEAGALQRDNVTMQTIRTWLGEHPGEAEAMMARNRSYIFFREAPASDPLLGPIGAAKVPLTPTRSLAVDRLIHSFHTPVWVETRLPDGRWFRRLMIAQDTGSAIVGPARGDIFFGSGAAAGAVAGAMRAGGRFVVLMPRGDGR